MKTCNFCKRIFFNDRNREEHELNAHTKKLKLSCKHCKKLFGRLNNLVHHEKNCQGELFNCKGCNKSFSRKGNLNRHKQNCNDNNIDSFQCKQCSKSFLRKDSFWRHEKACSTIQHPIQEASGSGIKRKIVTEEKHPFDIETVSTAFEKAVKTYKIKFSEENDNIETAIKAMKERLVDFQTKEKALKFSMAIHVEFEKAADSSVITDPPVVLQSEQFEIYHDTSIEDQLVNVGKQLNNNIEVYELCGSGWVLHRIVALDTTIWKLDPLRASSYHELPKWIIDKRAVINVKNNDQFCFKWSVLAGLHQPTINRNLTSSYTGYEKNYDFSGLTFPVSLRKIKIFEDKNNVSINVYSIEGEEKGKQVVYPLKVTLEEQSKHVNLLLTEENNMLHYSTVKNISRLVRSQTTNNTRTHEYCYSCLQGFQLKQNEKQRGDCEMIKKHQQY